MSRIVWTAVVIGAFGVSACDCGGGRRSSRGGPDSGSDAGGDASVRDAGADAGPDAGPPDGGPADTGPADTGVDALADGGAPDAATDSGVTPRSDATYSLGENHTCAIDDAAGHVRCWGYNTDGVLGVGSSDAVAIGLVPGVVGARALAAGGYHTCALLADDTVTCWGYNEEGQVGDGTSGNVRTVPAVVAGLTGVTGIYASANTTCAIVTEGTVWCWGDNGSDQIIEGGAAAIVTPTAIAAHFGASTVAVGNYHICALLDGSVACTGSLAAETFGDPVADISSGWQHSCAVAGGVTYCWGDSYLGTLGDGVTAAGTHPAQVVPGIPGTVISVKTGIYHSCALTIAGDLWCWGNNQGGAIDPAAPHDPGYRPAVVATGVETFGVGGVHVCVTDGTFRCWGNDWAGAVTGTPSP